MGHTGWSGRTRRDCAIQLAWKQCLQLTNLGGVGKRQVVSWLVDVGRPSEGQALQEAISRRRTRRTLYMMRMAPKWGVHPTKNNFFLVEHQFSESIFGIKRINDAESWHLTQPLDESMPVSLAVADSSFCSKHTAQVSRIGWASLGSVAPRAGWRAYPELPEFGFSPGSPVSVEVCFIGFLKDGRMVLLLHVPILSPCSKWQSDMCIRVAPNTPCRIWINLVYKGATLCIQIHASHVKKKVPVNTEKNYLQRRRTTQWWWCIICNLLYVIYYVKYLTYGIQYTYRAYTCVI